MCVPVTSQRWAETPPHKIGSNGRSDDVTHAPGRYKGNCHSHMRFPGDTGQAPNDSREQEEATGCGSYYPWRTG